MRVQIEAAGFVVAGEVDVIPDPVDIDQGVDAVVLQQGHGDGGNGGGFDVGEGTLQHGEAGNAHDGLDRAGLDERHDDGAAFGHEHGVAELFSFVLEILDRAKAALLAEQAEFIKGGRAFAFDAEALRHQQQALFKRHGGEGLAPGFIGQQHPDVVTVNFVDGMNRDDLIRVPLQIGQGHWRHQFLLLGIGAHPAQDLITILLGLRDVFLRLTNTAVQTGDGRWQSGRADDSSGHGEKTSGRMPGEKGGRVNRGTRGLSCRYCGNVCESCASSGDNPAVMKLKQAQETRLRRPYHDRLWACFSSVWSQAAPHPGEWCPP